MNTVNKLNSHGNGVLKTAKSSEDVRPVNRLKAVDDSGMTAAAAVNSTTGRSQSQRRHRTIGRTLMVSVGGSGNAVGSRLKGLLKSQGTVNFTKWVAIDTDEHAQSGGEGWPAFEDNEFLHVSCDRIFNVIDHPDAHPILAARHDIRDPGVTAFFQRLTAAGISQGGQVRPYGNLAYHANFSTIRAALQNAITELNGAYSVLEKQLECDHEVQVRRRMTVYVVFSNAGGTGSSMALETMYLIRELTRQMDVEIVAVMLMASAFESVLKGQAEQIVRMQANAYANMLEINAIRQGFGTENGMRIGPDERRSFTAEAGVMDQLFVVGLHTADGRSLGSPQAVEDTVALYLAALIGTEVNDRVVLSDANHATLRGITPDRMTKQPRDLGTIGATALTFPAGRIAENCSLRAADRLLHRQVLGRKPDDTIHQAADAWLLDPVAGESILLQADALATSLQRSILPNVTSPLRPLFRHCGTSGRVHFGTSEFVEKADGLPTRLQSVQFPEFDGRLGSIVSALSDECQRSLRKQYRQVVVDHGYLSAQVFAHHIEHKLRDAAERSRADSQAALTRSRSAHESVMASVTSLKGLLRNRFSDTKRKDQIASRLQEFVTSSLKAMCCRSAADLLTALLNTASELQQSAADVASAATDRRQHLRSKAGLSEVRQKSGVTAGTLAEIDVSTPETERTLFREHCPDDAELLELLSRQTGVSTAAALKEISINGQSFDDFMAVLAVCFKKRLQAVSVVDVLALQLSDPVTSDDTKARIRQTVAGCQPLWKAESGQLATEFADAMIVGVPSSANSQNRRLVVEAVVDAATRRINANGQYNSGVNHVLSGDPHRIYVIRRTQGACFYYLPEVHECEAAYREWKDMGGHSVHIFNNDLIAKMPSLLPSDAPVTI